MIGWHPADRSARLAVIDPNCSVTQLVSSLKRSNRLERSRPDDGSSPRARLESRIRSI
jgi:hypothetical protein